MTRYFAIAALSALLTSGACFAQTTMSVDPYGDPCGLNASGSIQPNGASRRIELDVTDAPERGFIVFLISAAPGDQPLTGLGSACHLLLDGVPQAQVHRTRADGTYRYAKALGQIYPIDVYVQFLTFEYVDGQLSIETSEGLHVTYL